MELTIINEQVAQEIKRREDVIAGHLLKIKRSCVVNDQLIKVVAYFCKEVEPSEQAVKRIFYDLALNPKIYNLSYRDFKINRK